MLIWLNGPFGVGKTSTAEALIKRLPCAALFDPEPVASMLRHLLRSVEPVDDFQDLAAWRRPIQRRRQQNYPPRVRFLGERTSKMLVEYQAGGPPAPTDDVISPLQKPPRACRAC